MPRSPPASLASTTPAPMDSATAAWRPTMTKVRLPFALPLKRSATFMLGSSPYIRQQECLYVAAFGVLLPRPDECQDRLKGGRTRRAVRAGDAVGSLPLPLLEADR